MHKMNAPTVQISMLFLLFSFILCSLKVSSGSPLQLVNSNGFHASDSTLKKFSAIHPLKKLRTLSVLDCTGSGDCKLVNKVLDTSFRNVNGISLDIIKDTAILYAAFNTTFSAKFCGAKAVDYQCLLSTSPVQPSLTIAMAATDLELALYSYDQLFRRLLKFKHDSVTEDQSKQLLTVTVLLDESGVDADSNSGVQQYASQIDAFLRQLWTEQYDKEDFPASLKVEVVPVRTEDPSMLERARASLRTILQEHSRSVSTAEEGAPGSGADGAQEVRDVSVEQLTSVLVQMWKDIPKNVHPVLSLAQREALYEIESAATSGRNHADAAIRQWQTRVAKGRTVGKFSSRVEQLLGALRRDFYQRTSGQTAASLVRERGDRLQTLRQHVLGSAGRLFLQQLVVLEFHCVAGFKRQLGKLIAREDLDETGLKEQEQVELRKALFDFRAQASDLEDPALGFLVSPDRIAELTSTLEAVLAEFPDTPSAKLEEVRKMERQAQRGKLAPTPRTGRGRKRKGIAKALGVTLGLVGMLRPAGFGNLQGYIGYMTSLLGLPLEMMLGVQNDGETPEIKGEDREHPLLRLQPKLKFEIDL